jgi:hypothetical protein
LSEATRKQREELGTRVRWVGPAQGSKVVDRVALGGSTKLSTSGLVVALARSDSIGQYETSARDGGADQA